MAITVPRARVRSQAPIEAFGGPSLAGLGAGLSQAGSQIGQIGQRQARQEEAELERAAARQRTSVTSRYGAELSTITAKYQADPTSRRDDYLRDVNRLRSSYLQDAGLTGEFLDELSLEMETQENSNRAVLDRHLVQREARVAQAEAETRQFNAKKVASDGWDMNLSAGGWDTWISIFEGDIVNASLSTTEGLGPEAQGATVAGNMRDAVNGAVQNMVNSLDVGPSMDTNYAVYTKRIEDAPGLNDTERRKHQDRLDQIYAAGKREQKALVEQQTNEVFINLGKELSQANEYGRARLIDRAIEDNPLLEPELRKFGKRWTIETQPGVMTAGMILATTPDLTYRQKIQQLNILYNKNPIAGKDWISIQKAAEQMKDDGVRQKMSEFLKRINLLSQTADVPDIELADKLNDPSLSEKVKEMRDALTLLGAEYLRENPDRSVPEMVQKFQKEIIKLEGEMARGTVADKVMRRVFALERKRADKDNRRKADNPLVSEAIKTQLAERLQTAPPQTQSTSRDPFDVSGIVDSFVEHAEDQFNLRSQ